MGLEFWVENIFESFPFELPLPRQEQEGKGRVKSLQARRKWRGMGD